MNKSDNKQHNVTNVAITMRLEQAFKQDRLGGWPSIIGLAGTITIFVNMLISGWEAYINLGSISLYLWELCPFFFAIAVAFVPASLKDGRYLAEGKQKPSVKSYFMGIIMRFLIAGAVIVIVTKLL